MSALSSRENRVAVSLLVLTYRQARFVAEAVQSALAQDCPDLEIIISDDASDDGTFEIIEDLVDRYNGPHQVQALRQPVNLGLSRHLNTLIGLSRGDLIVLAAGDDVSRADRCRTLAAAAGPGDWLLHSDVDFVDFDGNACPPSIAPDKLTLLRRPSLRQIVASESLYIGATGAITRKLWDKYGGLPQDGLYEDQIFGFRASLEQGVRHVPQPLVRYRCEGGMSGEKHTASLSEFLARRDKRAQRRLATLRVYRTDALHQDGPEARRLIPLLDRRIRKLEARAKARLDPIAALKSANFLHGMGEIFSLWKYRRRFRSRP